MSDLEVHIVKLESMRVAAALGFGAQPEGEAWSQLWTWIKAQGLGDKIDGYRFFGFNNPSPAPGSPNYGYEQWITVGSDAREAGKVTIKEFPGGLYAVAHMRGIPNPDIWRKLVQWREENSYKPAYHQWLEECLTPALASEPGAPEDQWEFDLYLPIAE